MSQQVKKLVFDKCQKNVRSIICLVSLIIQGKNLFPNAMYTYSSLLKLDTNFPHKILRNHVVSLVTNSLGEENGSPNFIL